MYRRSCRMCHRMARRKPQRRPLARLCLDKRCLVVRHCSQPRLVGCLAPVRTPTRGALQTVAIHRTRRTGQTGGPYLHARMTTPRCLTVSLGSTINRTNVRRGIMQAHPANQTRKASGLRGACIPSLHTTRSSTSTITARPRRRPVRRLATKAEVVGRTRSTIHKCRMEDMGASTLTSP